MDTSSVSGDSRAPVLPSGVRPLLPGDPAEIGGHSLVGRLGAGGMGVVYLGCDEEGGLVAVKVAHASLAGEEEVQARFRAEATCLSRVPAHCTARLLVDGTGQLPPYVVTEYVAGRSLKDIVEHDGPLSPEQLRALAAGLVRALAAVHRAGLVHRDLKPANVLLTPTGPRIIDFGIAQQVSASGGPTAAGMVVGSVGWIAPERLTRKPATPASDVFGWGCLVAYAGIARNPFGTGSVDEVTRRVIFGTPDLEGLDPAVRPSVAAALARTPADRPTAEQLLSRLSPADPLAEPEQAPRTETGRARPTRKALAACAVSAVITAAATVITLTMTDTTPKTPHPGNGSAIQRPGSSPSTTRSAVVSPAPVAAPRHSAPATSRRAAKPGKADHGHKPPGAKKPAHGKKPGPTPKSHGHP